MKRFIAYATSALLGVGGLMAVAAPASAHHSTVTPTIQCATGGNYTVTWSVQNWDSGSENLIGTVTSSSRGVVPVGTSFEDNQVKTFNETVSGKQALVLDVSMKWSNGVTATNHGSIGTSSFPSCTQSVPTTPPSVTPPTCAADGTLVVPADTAAIDYSQNPAGSGPGTYEVNATAKSGYALTGTSHWNVNVLPKLTGEQCDSDVTPVAPDVVVIDGCGKFGSVTFKTTEGVTYALTSGDGKTGAYTVTATVKPGYKLAAGAQSVFNGNLGTHTTCVSATPPVEVDPTCDIAGSVTLPAAQAGISYSIEDLGNGVYQVVAETDEGFELVGPSMWTVDTEDQLSGPECDEFGNAVAPAVDQIDGCGELGSVAFDNSSDDVTYALTSGDGKQGTYEVTATAAEGYKFAEGAQTVFKGDLGTHTDCAAVSSGDDQLLPDTGAGTSLLMLLMVGAMVAVGAVLIAAGRQPAMAASPAARRVGPRTGPDVLRGTRADRSGADLTRGESALLAWRRRLRRNS
ncbi:MAG: hypothetical protein ABIN55_08025 [Aeromicrobium sp.]